MAADQAAQHPVRLGVLRPSDAGNPALMSAIGLQYWPSTACVCSNQRVELAGVVRIDGGDARSVDADRRLGRRLQVVVCRLPARGRRSRLEVIGKNVRGACHRGGGRATRKERIHLRARCGVTIRVLAYGILGRCDEDRLMSRYAAGSHRTCV